MSAPKKSPRARRAMTAAEPPKVAAAMSAHAQAPSIHRFVCSLREATADIETVYNAVSDALNSDEDAMLQEGVEALREVLSELEKFELELSVFRRSHGAGEGVCVVMDTETAYNIAVGRVLRDHRESLGLSVADIAGKPGLPQLRIEQIEAGSIYAVAADLLRLAIGLNTPIERFTIRIDAVVKELE